MKKTIICFLILFGLSSCKLDFVGDVYTSDLISIAEKGGSINLPMEIRFQVSSCDDDQTSLNKKIGSYFIDYKQVDCGTGDDFMSYIKSKISVPITNNKQEFETQNKSLIGYLSTLNEETKKTEVYLVVNLQKLGSLSDYVESETFQKLSLVDGKFKIKGYDGPTLECHKCGSEMQLKTGRFGKYFGCLNDNCGATRALQRNGEPKPITMEPIEMPDLKCIKCEDHYLLRDSMKGLFLAASQYPKNRETRAPKVSEINKLHNEIVEACRFLPNKEKHMYLLEAPENDVDGNPYIIRYNRTDDVHYLASEKDGKKTKWTATYSDGEWIQNLKS